MIVTDGFTGNVCLKTIEGTSKVLFKTLKDVMMRRRLPSWALDHQGRLEAAYGAGQSRYVRRRAASWREGRMHRGAWLVERLCGKERRSDHGELRTCGHYGYNRADGYGRPGGRSGKRRSRMTLENLFDSNEPSVSNLDKRFELP